MSAGASGIAALNNVTTANAYAPTSGGGATLFCEGSTRQFFAITGAAVYVRILQRFTPGLRAGGPGVELFIPPGYYDRQWLIDRMEFKSAVANTPAQVTAHAD
jgi:hypothetical protein